MNKTEELKKLAGEVFDGCPDWCTHAAMKNSGMWMWFSDCPFLHSSNNVWNIWLDTKFLMCQNQPVTDLPWQETLLRRGDYE